MEMQKFLIHRIDELNRALVSSTCNSTIKMIASLIVINERILDYLQVKK
jgi:hypothetical protein